MDEKIDEGIIKDAVEFITIKQTEKILSQMKKSICKIKGKLVGTGFFLFMNNSLYLMTNHHVLDDKYIRDNKSVEISMNDNNINEEIIINQEDIIYLSERDKYDLIVIKLKEQEFMKNIEYLELDDKLFNKNSIKGYDSIYILHYPNSKNASVSYGNGITKRFIRRSNIKFINK